MDGSAKVMPDNNHADGYTAKTVELGNAARSSRRTGAGGIFGTAACAQSLAVCKPRAH